MHLPSGRVYNLSYNRPKVDGRDDETGEPLTKRPDDNPVSRSRLCPHPHRPSTALTPPRPQEVFARRLRTFYTSTSPLLAYYASDAARTRVVTLTGATSDEIWPQLEGALRTFFPRVHERGDVRRRTSLSEAVLGREARGARRKDVK